MKTLATALAVLFAWPVMAMENGECVTLSQADTYLEEHGEAIVAHIPLPNAVRVLVRRADGSFKEIVVFPSEDRACHAQDFIGDPRDTGAAL